MDYGLERLSLLFVCFAVLQSFTDCSTHYFQRITTVVGMGEGNVSDLVVIMSTCRDLPCVAVYLHHALLPMHCTYPLPHALHLSSINLPPPPPFVACFPYRTTTSLIFHPSPYPPPPSFLHPPSLLSHYFPILPLPSLSLFPHPPSPSSIIFPIQTFCPLTTHSGSISEHKSQSNRHFKIEF